MDMVVEIEVDGELEEWRVPQDDPYLLMGRSARADIRLDGRTVSHLHLVLRWSNGWCLQDISTNGSLYNGNWLEAATVYVGPDDVVELGSHRLVLRGLPEPQGVESTARRTRIRRLSLPEPGLVRIAIGAHPVEDNTIRRQQWTLLRSLASCYDGQRDFGWLSWEDELEVLEAYGGPTSPTANPGSRVYTSRSRLRQWWTRLLEREGQRLSACPDLLFETDQKKNMRLRLRVDTVAILGHEIVR